MSQVEGRRPAEQLLEVNGLTTHFFMKDATVRAVDGVTFSLGTGETYGIVGESGSGKSMTLKSILRLVPPPGKIIGGSIQYGGLDLLALSLAQMRLIRGREIGMIFQEPMTALNPVLSIKQQITESLDTEGMSHHEKLARAVELLKLVGVPSAERRLEEYPHQFSGGMRQRAMIAITLARQPKILMADEPTTALDVTVQDQILKLITGLKDSLGMSVILVTHDLGIVAQMCDRVAVMYAGKIVETADTLSLFSSPRHPYTIGLMGSLPHGRERGTKLRPIKGFPPDLTSLPEGCSFAPRCEFAAAECREAYPPPAEVAPGHMASCYHTAQMVEFKGIVEHADEEGGS